MRVAVGVQLVARRLGTNSRPGGRQPAAWTAVTVSGMVDSPGPNGSGDAGSCHQTSEQENRASCGLRGARGSCDHRCPASTWPWEHDGGLNGSARPGASAESAFEHRRPPAGGLAPRLPLTGAESSAPASVLHLGHQFLGSGMGSGSGRPRGDALSLTLQGQAPICAPVG